MLVEIGNGSLESAGAIEDNGPKLGRQCRWSQDRRVALDPFAIKIH